MKMELPEPAARCLEALEQAGFAAYAVGGCVRDACLGRTPKDYDLCTAALPEQTAAVFQNYPLERIGSVHGTIGVQTEMGTLEITTFRKEGTYGDNRHPDWVEFVTEIREDLARRDFTVNAMAYSPVRGLCDPFGGQRDLEEKILRTVGDPTVRFQEDALRILRGLRFAVRFGLKVEKATLAAMTEKAALLKALSPERVLEELSGALPLMDAEELRTFAPVLSAVIPELAPMVGFDQHSPHHKYDLYMHTALVTQQVPEDLTLRWTALLHDIGKIPTFTRDENGRGHFYGHAPAGAEMAKEIFARLKASAVLRDQAVTLIGEHMTALETDKKQLRRRISRLGWDTADKLWYLQRADLMSKGTDTEADRQRIALVRREMEQIRTEEPCLSIGDLKITGRDLLALGYTGKAIGDCLQDLLDRVMDETIPNTREALLAEAEKQKL